MKSTSWMFALGLGACVLVSAGIVRAQSADAGGDRAVVEQAQKHFAQGVRLYAEADFASALAQFQRAYQLKPHFKILYNIAQCSFELRDYVEARASLRRYLAESSSALDPERRARIDADLEDLERRIGHLEIRSNARGASVYVDGRKIGTTPLVGAIDVSEGQRAVSVEFGELGVRQRSGLLAGGESKVVEVTFDQPTPRAALPQTSVERGAVAAVTPDSGLGAGFWTASAGAVLLAGGAGLTGYLSLRAQSGRRQALDRPGTTAEELASDRKRIQVLALSTDLLAGGAIVCAGIAITMFVLSGSDSHQIALSPDRIVVSGSF